jgi:hypothetical protein
MADYPMPDLAPRVLVRCELRRGERRQGRPYWSQPKPSMSGDDATLLDVLRAAPLALDSAGVRPESRS